MTKEKKLKKKLIKKKAKKPTNSIQTCQCQGPQPKKTSQDRFLKKKKKKKKKKKNKKEKDVKINTNVMSYSERALVALSLLRGQYTKKILNGKMDHYVFLRKNLFTSCIL